MREHAATDVPQIARRAPEPFPWDDVLAFCLGEVGLAPDAVWRATPREVALMIRARRGRAGAIPAPRPADFADLLTRYPDTPN